MVLRPTSGAVPMTPTIGFRIEHDGASVVLAGDTVPCAGLDALARQVVEPDAHARCGELCGGSHAAFSSRVSRAAATTASVVMPNFSNRVW